MLFTFLIFVLSIKLTMQCVPILRSLNERNRQYYVCVARFSPQFKIRTWGAKYSQK